MLHIYTYIMYCMSWPLPKVSTSWCLLAYWKEITHFSCCLH